MMKKIFFIPLILLFIGCKQQKDVELFQHKFENCLCFIKKMHEGGAETDWRDRGCAYECLFAVTGIKGHTELGYIPYYAKTPESLQYDILAWEEWYESNKYTMTIQKADSLIYIHSLNIDWNNLKWPPSCDSVVIDRCIDFTTELFTQFEQCNETGKNY